MREYSDNVRGALNKHTWESDVISAEGLWINKIWVGKMLHEKEVLWIHKRALNRMSGALNIYMWERIICMIRVLNK